MLLYRPENNQCLRIIQESLTCKEHEKADT